MAFNPTQQAAFHRQIHQLKEEGIFLPPERSLTYDTRYLIISCGGLGTDTLFHVKKQFETHLSKQQLEERVRFLAIDTDKDAKFSTKPVRNPDGTTSIQTMDALSNDQFIHLSGFPARMCLNDTNVATWINPRLKERLLYDSCFLNGDGASGIRQIGRLTLYAAQNAAAVTTRVSRLAAQLIGDGRHPLQVFILSGIAGGTGSGAVIDLTYLIRNTLESMGIVAHYSGFILLPPVGNNDNPSAIDHGNSNGYAALKEISYFMQYAIQKEPYSMTYGNGQTVTSRKNIFDICYLLDDSSDNICFLDPRETAMHVLSGVILDMVCSTSQNPAHLAVLHLPQGENNCYCALGYSEFAIPRQEIKAYVAKKMFDQIYHLFRKCVDVTPEDTKEFFKNVLRNGAQTQSSTVHSLEKELESIFTTPRGGKGGPFYVVNLLQDLVDEIHYQRKRTRLLRIHMASDAELEHLEQYALHINHSHFQVYAATMDALKEILDEQFKAIVQSGPSCKIYTFIPSPLGDTNRVDSVIHYLDNLVNRRNLLQLTEALLQEMFQNRTAWTALIDSSDPIVASKAIRRFWNDQMDKIITASLEDLLIKYYSGDPEASYSTQTHNGANFLLRNAAEDICNQMLHDRMTAQPMIRFSPPGPQPNFFHSYTELAVPQCAPNLYTELAQVASSSFSNPQCYVCSNTSSDRITCYQQFLGIPAHRLGWVQMAETNYRHCLIVSSSIGIHLSETQEGIQWRSMPNLCSGLPEET